MRASSNQLNNPKAYKLFAVGLFSFLLSYTVASTFAPVANSSATDISDTKTQNFSVNVTNPYYISITSSHATAGEPISLDYGADGNTIGNVIATSDTVTTETNSPLTHYLYLSTTSNSNSLSSSDGHNNDTISAGGGDDLASASTLGDNTWGFALPSGTSGIPTNTFDTDYSSVSSSSKFAKVPTSGNDILIQSGYGGGSRKEMATTTSTADVYYAAKATADIPAGTYANVVRYTAYAEEPDFSTTMIDDLEYMQDITTEICNNSYTGMTARLKDKRGRGNAGSASDSSYGIIKAKDGNCWMTENFDLYNKEISAANSDFASGTFAIPDTSSSWDGSTTAALVHKSTSDLFASQVYYSWATATAGICPKGWQLPAGGTGSAATADKTYGKLLASYGIASGNSINSRMDSTHESYVLNFQNYGTYHYWGTENGQGEGGGASFWTSTPQSTNQAYDLLYDETPRVYIGDYRHKGLGFSVRCVSR